MSEQPPSESSRPPRRSRPSYGLPGPEGAPQQSTGTPEGYGAPPQGYGTPEGYGGPAGHGAPPQSGYGTPQQPWGGQPGAPQPWGGQQAPAWSGGPAPSPGGVGAQPRRKGVWQLIVGILVLIASVVVFVAMVFGATARPLAETLTSAEAVAPGSSVTLQAGEIRMVALAASDVAAGATCSLDIPSSQGLAQPVGNPFPVDVGGQPYEAVVQIAAYTPVDVALDCAGTSQPIALTAPMDTTELAGSLLGAFAVGTILGLLGLGLIVWGIIALVRSGRRISAWREGRPA